MVYGPNLKAMIVDLYAEGVVSNDRICGFMHAFSEGKLALSEGSIYNFCREFAVKGAPAIEQIKEVYHFGTGNGECNVHLLRYLQKNTEESGNSWSEDRAEL